MSPVELAALQALVREEEARQARGQIPDNRIVTDDGTEEENPMCRIDGPFQNRNKFRVRVVDRETKKAKSYIYETEQEALDAIPKLRRQYERIIGVTVRRAMDEYAHHLHMKELRPRTIGTVKERLNKLFTDEETITGVLTQSSLLALWAAFEARRVVSTAYRFGVLEDARRFLKWCHSKSWTKTTDLLDKIEVLGKVKKGKPQLTEDQSRRFLGVALARGIAGDREAVTAATCLLLGLRATEIVERVVSDLDANGTKLLITASKTEAGIRTMAVPGVLRPLLAEVARGKAPDAPLFDMSNRYRVLRAVQRLCRAAGVPVVPAHGLRGTHGRIAVQAGISGEAVARSLGHESMKVTREHYAGPQAFVQATADRVAAAFDGLVPGLSPGQTDGAAPL